MTNIERLQRELDGAYQAAYAAPNGSADWQHVNRIRAELNSAVEAAKTPEQRDIERLTAEVGLLQRKVNRLDASLTGAIANNDHLRVLIGAHTGQPTGKAIGLLAMDLELIRCLEDELANAVRAGDLEAAQRICINRNLPRPRPKTLAADIERIGLSRRTA